MMELELDSRVREYILGLPSRDRARVARYIGYFEEFGFQLPPKYLKKIEGGVWELRPGRARIFIYNRGDKIIGIHATVKASKKIKKSDLDLVKERVRYWRIK